jgi:hypothetical protein
MAGFTCSWVTGSSHGRVIIHPVVGTVLVLGGDNSYSKNPE